MARHRYAASGIRELRTLETTDPESIRRQALTALKDLADADGSVAYGLTHDGERPRMTNWSLVGDSRMNVAVRLLAENPELWPRQSLESFVAPPALHRNSFVLVDDVLRRDQAEQTALFTTVFKANGIRDQIRLLVTHGNRFVASVVALRGGGLFTRLDAQRATRGASDLAAALTAADTLESANLGTSAFAMIAPDGRVSHASSEATIWLDAPGFRGRLQQLIVAFDKTDKLELDIVLRRARVRVVRMLGTSVEYLACIRPASRLFLSPLGALPPMRRRVAELAAVGATIREIAAELHRSENTVKTQLQLVYGQLAVSSRLELARLITTPVENQD